MTAEQTKIVWAPQRGPQHLLIKCPYPLIGFGGARGGGKTDGVLGKYGIKADYYGKHFNGIFFRQELPQTDDLIERAKEIYLPIGAQWQEQKKQFIFEAGGRLRFRPLESDADAMKYQGQSITDAAVEEAGNYTNPSPLWKLFGALRSPHGVPTQLIMTFNPGGPGHFWLRDKFLAPAPLGLKKLMWKLPTGVEVPYIFIPSKVRDNPALLRKDPTYIDRLHMVGSPELVRAWLEGDFFSQLEGRYFPEFGVRHIIEPFAIPKHWTAKYLGFDWGYNSPFCAVWGVVSSGKFDDGRECPYPKGALIIYRELWGKGIDNDVIARKILEVQGDENPIQVADPSIFSHEGGPSIGDQFKNCGLVFKPADNDRVSGWSQIRRRLKPNPASIYFFSSCPYLIETIPGLAMDLKKPEDVDTTGEDHGADALRYLCKERLLESEHVLEEETARHGQVKIAAYVNQVRREQKQARL